MSNALKKEKSSIWGLLLAAFVFLSPLESFLIKQAGSLLKYYTIACVCLFAIRIFVKGKIKKPTPAQSCMLVFIAITALSVFWSPHSSRGVDILLSIALQIIFIFLALQVDFNQYEKNSFLMLYIFSTLILSVLVFLNAEMILSEGGRATASVPAGSDIDPNNIAAYIVGGFTILLSFETKTKFAKMAKFALQAIFLTATIMTISRGAIVAVFAVLLYNAFNKGKLRRTVFFIITMVVLFLVVYVVSEVLFGGSNPVILLINRFLEDEGGSGRLELWKIASKSIAEKPILGYGLGESPYVIGRKHMENIGTHNTFLTIWFESGIFALLAFVLMIVFLFKNRKKDRFNYSVYGMLLSSMASSFFIDTYNKKILWLPVMLCMIATTSKIQKK